MAAAASCSSSNPTLQWKYDVFLSFRGEDTRNNFTSHLYDALRNKAIHTFIDDNELERGEEISPALLKAIEESKISIIILSANYASSSWCLDELLKILECKNTIGQLVVPVFYRVDPSDVRKQTGSFQEAFAKHELEGKPDKVHKWRVALREVANIAGHPGEQNRPDSRLLHDIVEDIMMKLYHTSFGDFNGQVGIDSRIEQILSLLRIGLESACIAVGVWGMGGIGKTTIAKAIFNQISNQFEDCCFLENVREVSEKSGVNSLREELLAKILKDKNIKRGTVNLRSTAISDRLGRKKVLIVLDDVDDSSQLESIIGRFDQFGRGSRIIITTRNKRVLKNEDQIYEVEKLNDHESLRVLSLEAFEQNSPREDFMELSKMVVNYADGIPLALKVLGSFLFGRSKGEWKSALDRLKKTPNQKIQEVLRISYDGLNQMEMDIFCDIACFFKGWDKDHVMTILDGCGLFPNIGISVLVEKSLITISRNRLCMHDLLQEMGREIVREVSKEPGRRSRLWNNEDVYHVLTNKTGTEAVEGLFLDLYKIREASLSSTAFKGMCNLRFLKFYGISNKLHFPDGLESLSNKLSYLHWRCCPLESFPLNFQPENLVELDLFGSKVKYLWEGTQPLFKLKVIKLSNCRDLIKIPDLSKAPNLEHMDLLRCESLLEVHSSIQYLSKLMVLNLGLCKKLTSLPRTINLKSLRELHLSHCSNLKELPQRLYLMGTNIVSIPESIKHLSQLTYLNLCNCKMLQSLPELPSCLTNIRAENCISLQTISISSIRVTGAEQDLPVKMEFRYDNCLKLDQNSRNNIEADVQLKIQLYATTYQKRKNHHERLGPPFKFVCPGSAIPKWFSYKSEGFIVTAQLPPHWWCNSKFLGFALGVVVALKDGEAGSVKCMMGPYNGVYGHLSDHYVDGEAGSVQRKMRTYNGIYVHLSSLYVDKTNSEHLFLWYASGLELRKASRDCWYCPYNKASFQFYALKISIKKCGVHLLYAQEEN